MDFLGFILLWICSICLICRFLCFAKLKKKNQPLFFENVLLLNSFSSPSGVQMTQFLKRSSTSPLNSVYFFFSISSFRCSNWVTSVASCTNSLIPLSSSFSFKAHTMNFLVIILFFSPRILFPWIFTSSVFLLRCSFLPPFISSLFPVTHWSTFIISVTKPCYITPTSVSSQLSIVFSHSSWNFHGS